MSLNLFWKTKKMAKCNKRAVVFLAWGENFIDEVFKCSRQSQLEDYDKILVTDLSSNVPEGLKVVRANFNTNGHLRKTELIDFIPLNYDSYLFLDSDTVVISDITMGFEKAELFGFAVAPAPHYCLDHFWGFGEIMEKEGIKKSGQLLYNSGVIFFSPKYKNVTKVLKLWRKLGLKYKDKVKSDQVFLTLAMELLDFNPYTLSINYNYRGLGNLISGDVRVWHSHLEMPHNLNEFDVAWPPRRVKDGKVIFP